jgi:hypothetical protein
MAVTTAFSTAMISQSRTGGKSAAHTYNKTVVSLASATVYSGVIDMIPDGRDWALTIVAGALSHSLTVSICEADSGSYGIIATATLIGTAGGVVTLPYLNATYSEHCKYYLKLVSSTAAQATKSVTCLITAPGKSY